MQEGNAIRVIWIFREKLFKTVRRAKIVVKKYMTKIAKLFSDFSAK